MMDVHLVKGAMVSFDEKAEAVIGEQGELTVNQLVGDEPVTDETERVTLALFAPGQWSHVTGDRPALPFPVPKVA